MACRIEYSPDNCQGREAVEEVCQPPTEGDSRIELFALEAGIRQAAPGSLTCSASEEGGCLTPGATQGRGGGHDLLRAVSG